MTIKNLKKYKNILILGYGIEGKASERFLKRFCPEINIGIADEKDDPYYLDKQNEYDFVIKTPSIPKEKVIKPYTTATNIFFAETTNVTIGVTGTKGKSSTVTLIHSTLKEAGLSSSLVGNIGNPMLDALTDGVPDDTVFVVELSSYQLDDIQYSPHIACILNIYKEHHNHKDFKAYLEAKSNIVMASTVDDYYIYNSEFKELRNIVSQTAAKSIPYNEVVTITSNHNSQNIQAAITIALLLNISKKTITDAINRTEQLPHRLNNIGKFNGITFYDDSASTHPAATIFALSSLDHVQTVIIGGEDRGFVYDELADALFRSSVDNIILFPDTDTKVQKALAKLTTYHPRITSCNTMDEAVLYAFKQTSDGQMCLLSPGAPSYNMFSGFPERGKAFVTSVKKYAKKKSTKKKSSQKKFET